MTLYRQLLLFTFSLLLILFVGLWIAGLGSTRSFVRNQLTSHAQDTATSLGLSITSHIQTMDLPAMESMVNAIFDRGYYQVIRVLDLEGNPLVDRSLQVSVDKVPAWFIRMVPLSAPKAEAQVMSGWQRMGTVVVESHPGYAYLTLWDMAMATALLFAVAALLVISIGGLGLNLLLRPLKRVEGQALALCNRQYQVQERLPRTRELRRVVKAMNLVTGKIREMFDEQTEIAETLRHRVFQDQLTGMGNRRYLEAQVTALLQGDRSAGTGTLLLLQLAGLQALNLQRGYAAGDALLQEAASVIKQLLIDRDSVIFGRLTGADFTIYLANIDVAEAESLARVILEQLAQRLTATNLVTSQTVGHCGGVNFRGVHAFGDLLAQADNALRQARSNGSNQVVILPIREEDALGRSQWLTVLQHALHTRSIVLYGQPVVKFRHPDQVVHVEVLARIPHGDQILPAGMFIPLAEEHGLTVELDRIIVDLVLRHFAADPPRHRHAINICQRSLQDQGFYEWLINELKRMTSRALSCNLEFTEAGALQDMDRITALTRLAQGLGHRIGIDHFGRGLGNYGYLKSLRPDYVKLDRAFTNELIRDDADAAFFINSLCNASHSLDIQVMVEGVEDEDQLHRLQGLNLDAMQGYHIQEPELLRS